MQSNRNQFIGATIERCNQPIFSSEMAQSTPVWTRVPLPKPLTDEFVAHSVVAATDIRAAFAPTLSWTTLARYFEPDTAKNRPEGIDELKNADETLSRIAAEVLPGYWRTSPGDVIVVLTHGTAILVARHPGGPCFGGFACASNKGRSIPHHLPPHRFYDGEVGAAVELFEAQRTYDCYTAAHPEEKPYTDAALVSLNLIGYPTAGAAGSNANVVSLWRCGAPGELECTLWAALVECVCFGSRAVGVIVVAKLPAAARPDSPEGMKALADLGRDAVRNDFLTPRVAGCYTVPVA